MIWMSLVGCFGAAGGENEAWERQEGAAATRGTAFGRSGTYAAVGEGEEEEEEERGERRGGPSGGLQPGVPKVTDATWQAECGSCHMAYSPGLLPARSWTALLHDLPNHFGDDASLDPATVGKLEAYALANAADVVPYGLSAGLARASAGRTPLRILDIGNLRHEHGEVPKSWVVDNPEVKSLSNCAACHPGAAEGRFSEGEIRIPGHGRFDD